ncbi:flavonol 3-O-glucosyltransferase UGT89B1-like [Lycium barbarum]|uniref:flavonol 3-O-glucosyltransferase UGT89B1-like n=1 Tax=Lycium barbarum TaxID=112863 RepID=UPI00293E66B4|nr:flavonol 3-O-glucosyltransferase UGT89B1-like [Lycium barbarum]
MEDEWFIEVHIFNVQNLSLATISSYGLVINTFTELESVYLDHLMKDLGHGRVWSVGPVLLQDDEEDNSSVPSQRGGEILSWLDTCDDNSVVYVCFESQAVLTNRQMEELAKGLKRSGLKFIWSTKGHVSTDHGKIPYGLEDQVAGRGMVIREWAPQVLILRHQAVSVFLTHCGWNSILEGLVAGVTMLAWPMGADQFVNANLIVDELKVAVRVCEGAKTVPNSEELVGFLAEVVGLEGKGAELKARVSELRKAALNGIKGGGSSFENLEEFIKHLGEEAAKIKR